MRILHILVALLVISCNNRKNEGKKEIVPGKEQLLLQELSRFPDSLIVKENIIQFYREEGEYDKALNETNKALTKDTSNDRLYFIRGTLYAEYGDTAKAISSLIKAAQLYPTTDYMLRLATLYAESRDPNALEFIDKLGKYKVLPEQVLYLKGLYFSAVNDMDKCIAFMDQALNINFTFMDAYREKALALMHKQNYEAALLVLNKAVTLQNSFEEGYFYMGQCLEKLGRENESVEAYHKALMYDANYTEAKDALKKLGIKTR